MKQIPLFEKENYATDAKHSFLTQTFFLFLKVFATFCIPANYSNCDVCNPAKILIFKQITTRLNVVICAKWMYRLKRIWFYTLQA